MLAYRFKHILVRDAAYRATAQEAPRQRCTSASPTGSSSVPASASASTTRSSATTSSRPTATAPSWVSTTRPLAARAGRHLGAAGRRANDRGDVHAAANLLGRATALLPADSVERLELLLAYAYAVSESGRLLEASKINDELYERATALGERRLAMHARISHHGEFWSPEVDFEERRAIYEDGIDTFTALGDVAGLAKCTRLLGRICVTQGRRAEAAAWLERALVHANACGDLVTRRLVTQSLAMELARGPMPADDAIAPLRRAASRKH